MLDNFGVALLITLFAGLMTVVGGLLIFLLKKDDMKALSIGLGFSAGVMIFLSFTEVLEEAKHLLSGYFVERADWYVLVGFLVGAVIAVLIDYFIPNHIDGACWKKRNDVVLADAKCDKKTHRIRRAGIMTAIAIAIHNFPEGIATFFLTTHDLTLGISVAIAIGLHNIPEGIAVALPIYHATGKKRKAIWYSFLSGLSEPIGALFGAFILHAFLPEMFVGMLFASVAGIMVYISFDTLLPLSREYGNGHYSILGVILGTLFIWSNLLMLG